MRSEWIGKNRCFHAALAIVLMPAAASAGQIRVWPTAVVDADQVILADLAELREFDADELQRLRMLTVGDSPHPGSEVLVRIEDIHDALRGAGENLASISLMGATRCRVSRPRSVDGPSATVRPFEKMTLPKTAPAQKKLPQAGRAEPKDGTLEDFLREYLTARVGDHDGRVDISFVSAVRNDLQLSTRDYKFVVRKSEVSGQERSLGPASVAVELYRGGAVERTVYVAAQVRVGIAVVVARKPINRGQTITARHLKLEERLFDNWSKVGLTELYAAIGQQAKQFMRPGEMLAANAVQPRPIVRRGDVVTMWFRRGGLVVKTSGRAQQEGYLGSQIAVRRDGTRRAKDLIDAIVTGPGTVELVDSIAMAERE